MNYIELDFFEMTKYDRCSGICGEGLIKKITITITLVSVVSKRYFKY